jgi:hypothetical protein
LVQFENGGLPTTRLALGVADFDPLPKKDGKGRIERFFRAPATASTSTSSSTSSTNSTTTTTNTNTNTNSSSSTTTTTNNDNDDDDDEGNNIGSSSILVSKQPVHQHSSSMNTISAQRDMPPPYSSAPKRKRTVSEHDGEWEQLEHFDSNESPTPTKQPSSLAVRPETNTRTSNSTASTSSQLLGGIHANQVHEATLAELPPEIQAEVRRQMRMAVAVKPKKAAKGGSKGRIGSSSIQHFFGAK